MSKIKQPTISGRLVSEKAKGDFESLAAKYNVAKSKLVGDVMMQLVDGSYTAKVPIMSLISDKQLFDHFQEKYDVSRQELGDLINKKVGVPKSYQEKMENKQKERESPKVEESPKEVETEDIIAEVQAQLAQQQQQKPKSRIWVKILIGIVIVGGAYYVWKNHKDKIPFLKAKANVPNIKQ